MSAAIDAIVSLEHVSKKFRRGELHDSLRDLVPDLAAKLTGRRRSPSALRDREFWALHDISFDVARGEALGIVGSNGAGKSTLLKLLSAIMKPTSGTIAVRGRLSALIEVGAGFHPDLTGRENVYLNGTILGMSRKEIRAKFDDIVEFAGLQPFIDTPVKRYSSGMFARLGFSVAAHVEPDVLIVDEVLSVGDYLFQQKCFDRLSNILTKGTTVLFVSHDLHAISELCGRSILLEEGRMIAGGPTDHVIREYLSRAPKASDGDAPVRLDELTLRNERVPATRFESGARAFVDVTISAREPLRDVAIVLQIVDDNFYSIFDTCSARLNNGMSARLEAGDEFSCTFELDMHLASGTYHLNVLAYEYSTNQPLRIWPSVASFFIGQTPTMKGRANLNPRLRRRSITSCASLAAAEPLNDSAVTTQEVV